MKIFTQMISFMVTKLLSRNKSVSLAFAFLCLGVNSAIAQITSSQTGPWFTASTWVGGVVPAAASNVIIAAGHTVTVDGPVTRNPGTTTTVNLTGTLEAAAAYSNSGTTTINGSLQLNAGGTLSNNAPVYGAASTLIYNATSNTAPEWTGGASTAVAAGPGIPANVIVAAGTLTISASNGIPGNLQINPLCGLILTTGNLFIGGNLTNNGNFFANNSQAVEFVGTGTSVITAASGTQVFDGLVIAKTAGSVQIGSATNITIASSAGSVLQFLNAGTLDLNGRTLRFNSNGGNILVDGTLGGTVKNITSTSLATIAIANTKTVSGIASGTLSIGTNITVLLTGSFDCGGITTFNGTLQINAGGSVITNSPIYGTSSLLKYNSGTVFGRGAGWNVGIGTVGVTPGYPNDVLISNNTTFDAPNVGSSPFNIALKCGGNLTIDAGSGFFMDYGGGNNKSGFLKVGRNLLLNGDLSLGDAFGGDLYVSGNFTNNGAFIDNGRGSIFEGSGAQTISGTSAINFPHLTINNTSGTSLGVTLASPVNVANTLTLMAGVVNTTSANILNVSGTAAGAVIGGSTTAFVKGPMSRTLPASLASGSTYFFPVGKGASGYYPFTLNNPTSGVTGPVIKVEAFGSSSGGSADGTTLISISTSEYWLASNTGNLINSSVSLTRQIPIGTSNAIGKSATLTGAYGSIGGTVSGTSIVNSNTVTSLGYFVMGNSYCSSPTDNIWTGNVSTVWQNGGNWCSGIVPTGTINVTIPSGTPFQPVLDYNPAVNNLIIQTGATVTLSSFNLTVNGTLSGTGKFVGTQPSKLTLAGSGALGTLYLNTGGVLGSLIFSGSGSSLTLGSTLNIYDSLDVKGNTLSTGGFLTIKSTLNNTARIAAVTGSGSISGTVTVERFLPSNPSHAWRLLSVPVKGVQTFKQSWQENQAALANGVPGYGTILTSTTGTANGYDTITTGNSLLQWNGSAFTGVPATTNTMATNKGYFVFVRGDRSVKYVPGVQTPTPSGTTTLRTRGTLNDGVAQPSIAAAAGANVMVGNVYASPIDFLNITKAGISAFKLWDPKLQGSYNVGGYQTFSASTNPPYDPIPGGGSFGSTPNTKIESGQAFFVSSTLGGSIQLTEAAKTTGSRNIMRGTAAKAQLKATLYAVTTAGQMKADGNVVVFDNSYSNGNDDNDIPKATNFGENFGIINNSSTLVVDARKNLVGETENIIEYNISKLKKQHYAIEFSAQNIEGGVTAYLEDKYLGTKTPVNLTITQSVMFQVTAEAGSSAANRFRIVLQRGVKSPVQEMETTKAEFKVTPNPVTDGQIKVQFINQTEGRYTIRLLNALGQVIQSMVAAHAGGTAINRMSVSSKLSAGLYKIEVIKPNGGNYVQNLVISK